MKSALFILLASFSLATFAVPKIGEVAPDFQLQGTKGEKVKLSNFKGKWVVLEWFNKDCPFVRKFYDAQEMQNLQKTYVDKGVVWFQISSSVNGKEGHLTMNEAKKNFLAEKSASTDLLLDSDGRVGKSFGAKTTPHMFIINPEGKVVYAGAIDDKPSTEKEDLKSAKNYVKAALDEGLSGKPVTVSTTRPYGCSVKY